MARCQDALPGSNGAYPVNRYRGSLKEPTTHLFKTILARNEDAQAEAIVRMDWCSIMLNL